MDFASPPSQRSDDDVLQNLFELELEQIELEQSGCLLEDLDVKRDLGRSSEGLHFDIKAQCCDCGLSLADCHLGLPVNGFLRPLEEAIRDFRETGDKVLLLQALSDVAKTLKRKPLNSCTKRSSGGFKQPSPHYSTCKVGKGKASKKGPAQNLRLAVRQALPGSHTAMAALREKKISVHEMPKDQCKSLLRVALNGLVDMRPGTESTVIEEAFKRSFPDQNWAEGAVSSLLHRDPGCQYLQSEWLQQTGKWPPCGEAVLVDYINGASTRP